MYVRLLFMLTILQLLTPARADAVILSDDLAGGGQGSSANMNMSGVHDLHSVQAAFNNSTPMANTLIVQYRKGQTVKVRCREYMETAIFMPEQVKSYILGDSKNFKWTPSNDKMYGRISVIFGGADTNLTLIGESGDVYSFYLRADTVKSKFVPILNVFVENGTLHATDGNHTTKQEAPKTTATTAVKVVKGIKQQADGEYLRALPSVDPTKLRYGYYVKAGDESLAPLLVFDDGSWTYFRFAAKNLDRVERLPTIYKVVDGYDHPVNFQVKNGTVIAKSVSTKWTLRSGRSHLCIRRRGSNGN